MNKREQLLEEGYCLFEGVLEADLLRHICDTSDVLLDALPPRHFEQQKSTGSMISVYDDPGFAELVTCPAAIDALRSLGFTHPKWWSGYVISKPPQSPPLFWHQDWWGWNDPISYDNPIPQQTFLMYYLVDTERDNGCLRLIPGSHIKRHPLHDAVPEAHTDVVREMEDPNSPVYADDGEAVDVAVKAGDLIVGDSRLLHSAHGNSSPYRRTVITLWYFPEFDELPEGLRAFVTRDRRIDAWPENIRQSLTDLTPFYNGVVQPIGWNRTPGPEFN